MGIALQLLASGFLATSWGWQAIFYANGTLGALWAVTYIIFGADSPERSRFISKEEVLYIQTSLGRVGEQKVRTYSNIKYFSCRLPITSSWIIKYTVTNKIYPCDFNCIFQPVVTRAQ